MTIMGIKVLKYELASDYLSFAEMAKSAAANAMQLLTCTCSLVQ